MAYEAVIGLECHLQLRTRSKMFCECPAAFGADPNSNVCPVCLGLPGALPVANRAAIEGSLRLGLALDSAIRSESVFARKHYFYPDMPKNYQITQYDRPLCEGGALPVTIAGEERRFELIRIHIEEDTGKSFHPERAGDRRVSRVDFNRAGVPLLEIVTRPVFGEPAEAAAFLTALRRLSRWLQISDADMEKGQLRCDANVSLRPAGARELGTKTELKNLNSIKGVEKGLTAEIARQRRVLEGGGRIEQATLLYDADHDKLAVMRTKEHAHDYRYFPDPDLPVLEVADAWRDRVRAELPELPWARERRLVADYGLPAYDAAVLSESRELADYFEEAAQGSAEPKKLSNWVMGEVLGAMNRDQIPLAEWRRRVPPSALRSIVEATQSAVVTAAAGKTILDQVFRTGADPKTLFVEHAATGSAEELLPLIREVIAAHPGPVAQVLAGKSQTLGFLVGQVMKRSEGRAVPQRVQELLREELGRHASAES